MSHIPCLLSGILNFEWCSYDFSKVRENYQLAAFLFYNFLTLKVEQSHRRNIEKKLLNITIFFVVLSIISSFSTMRFLPLLRCSLLVLKFVESVFAVFKRPTLTSWPLRICQSRVTITVLIGEKYIAHVRMIVCRNSHWLEVSVIDFLSSRWLCLSPLIYLFKLTCATRDLLLLRLKSKVACVGKLITVLVPFYNFNIFICRVAIQQWVIFLTWYWGFSYFDI